MSIAMTESLVFAAGCVYALPVPTYTRPRFSSIVGLLHTAAPAGDHCGVPFEFCPVCTGVSVIV